MLGDSAPRGDIGVLAVELALTPTEALIDELMSRCDHAVVIVKYKEENGTTLISDRWRGDLHMCFGMVSDVAHKISMQLMTR